MIRNELQRYIDASGRTKTSVMIELGVNSNSFGKFMNPKTYKDQWSAVQNGTYWAAARFLAKQNHLAKEQKKQEKKRRSAGKSNDGASAPKKAKKSAAEEKAEAEVWMTQVMRTAVDVDGADSPVSDSCPQVVEKIKKLLNGGRPGVTKANFCRIALSGANHNSLAKFLASKKQDQAGNQCYRRAYAFFEKQRIIEGAAKTKARIKNEMEKGPEGFDTRASTTRKWSYISF
jgi:hypothetical protein